MKPSKLHILFYFLCLRFTRKFSSARVLHFFKKKWLKNLQKSDFYRPFLQKKLPFPLLEKSSFMANFDVLNTVGISKKEAFAVAAQSEASRDFSPMIRGISVGLSSGTSGNKGIFLTTKREKAIWVAAVLDRVIGFSFKARKVAFFLLANNNMYEAVQSKLIQFKFFDIQSPIEMHVPILLDFQADILVAQPSVLVHIAELFQQENRHVTFSKVISVAEVLEDDQKAFLNSIFNCRIDQVYQCTEGFLAHTCKAGKLHFNEDWLEIEKKYLDKTQTRFHPIITDYLRFSQPVVRYELNDIIHGGPACSCGLKSTVIQKIEGRSDDVFRFKTADGIISIYPDFVRRAVITASDAIENYIVTRSGAKTLKIYLETPENAQKSAFAAVEASILALFSSYGIEDIMIESFDYAPDFSKKFKRIRNEYSETL